MLDCDNIDIEYEIYNDEQLYKLHKLRDDEEIRKLENRKIITKHDYYKSFKIGDKVFFNYVPGVISYCHKPNTQGDLQFSIKVGHKESKYINPFRAGVKITKRGNCNTEPDKTNIPDKIKRMHTKELINLLHDHFNDGVVSADIIKLELSKREHIPSKIESKNNRRLKAKLGGSSRKSKNK